VYRPGGYAWAEMGLIPPISQHLRILKQARLVIDRPSGNRRLYEVNPDGIDSLRKYFDRFWTQALAAFKRAVEAPPHKEAR